jgi:hypothetical protein
MAINAFQRAILAQAFDKGRVSVSWVSLASLRDAGLVSAELGGDVSTLYRDELTPAGVDVARTESIKLQARRNRRNATARGRADAMRSLGMRRTPYGWE